MDKHDVSLHGTIQRIIPNEGSTAPVTLGSAETARALAALGLIEPAPDLGPNTWRPTGEADANRIRDWLGRDEWERQVLDGEVPMLYIEHRERPTHATYRAQATLQSDGWGKMTPGDYGWAGTVKIAWYEDRVKITLPGAAPSAITQAYMTGHGKDVILEITKAGPSEDET